MAVAAPRRQEVSGVGAGPRCGGGGGPGAGAAFGEVAQQQPQVINCQSFLLEERAEQRILARQRRLGRRRSQARGAYTQQLRGGQQRGLLLLLLQGQC